MYIPQFSVVGVGEVLLSSAEVAVAPLPEGVAPGYLRTVLPELLTALLSLSFALANHIPTTSTASGSGRSKLVARSALALCPSANSSEQPF